MQRGIIQFNLNLEIELIPFLIWPPPPPIKTLLKAKAIDLMQALCGGT